MRITNVTVFARWWMTNLYRDLALRYVRICPGVNKCTELVTLANWLGDYTYFNQVFCPVQLAKYFTTLKKYVMLF